MASDDFIPAMPQEQVRALVGAHWQAWAAHAYSGFKKHGRGVVAVNLDVPTPEGATDAHGVTYVAEGSKRLRERGGWPDERTARMVKTYDPETQIVVVFIRPGGFVDVTCATAQGRRPTPRHAFDAGLSPLSGFDIGAGHGH